MLAGCFLCDGEEGGRLDNLSVLCGWGCGCANVYGWGKERENVPVGRFGKKVVWKREMVIGGAEGRTGWDGRGEVVTGCGD